MALARVSGRPVARSSCSYAARRRHPL
jgi:hypothetical protein